MISRAAEPADVIIGAEGTTGSLRESLRSVSVHHSVTPAHLDLFGLICRIPFTAATTFSLHTLNNKAPPGGGNSTPKFFICRCQGR